MKKILLMLICLLVLAGNGWGATLGGDFGLSGGALIIGGEPGFSFGKRRTSDLTPGIDYDGVWSVYETVWGTAYTKVWE